MASRAQNRAEELNSGEIKDLLDGLQARVDRCKVVFEQYFLGIQKTPPYQLQTDLERQIRKLTQSHIANTGLRFRFTTLSQKFSSYNAYWKRTMRRIENGTYVRDIARVGRDAVRSGKDVPDEILATMPRRMRERILKEREGAVARAQRAEKAEAEKAEEDTGKVRDHRPRNQHSLCGPDLDDLDLDSIFSELQKTSAPPRPASQNDVAQAQRSAREEHRVPPTSSPSSAKPPPGMSVEDSRSLYRRYRKAKEIVGIDLSTLSYDRLMQSLHKQVPSILSKHNAKGVRFDVVVRKNKVILKAKPE